jgi:hypothetical protein
MRTLSRRPAWRTRRTPTSFQWAATKRRVLVSHDHRTMRAHAEERLRLNLPMAGLILVAQEYPIGPAIDDLALIAEATTADEWDGKIVVLPL